MPRLAWARDLAEPPRWLADWDTNTCKVFARVGSKVGLGWAREGGCDWKSWECVLAAVRGGHVDVLEWLLGQGVHEINHYQHLTDQFLMTAAKYGQLKVIVWALELGCKANKSISVCEGAAMGGQLEVLKWARVQKPPCPWAFARPRRDKSSCYYAARGGQLEVLQWLRAQQPPCPWDASTCTAASDRGHLKLLQWARAHGCPVDDD